MPYESKGGAQSRAESVSRVLDSDTVITKYTGAEEIMEEMDIE